MPRQSLFLVVPALCAVYLAARVSSQYFEDPTKFYKNMTFNYDVRHRGELGLPPCVKQLMECWELVKPDIVCSHQQYYESVCMLMKNERCHDLAPFGRLGWPYDNFHFMEEYCPKNDLGYWTMRRQMKLAGH